MDAPGRARDPERVEDGEQPPDQVDGDAREQVLRATRCRGRAASPNCLTPIEKAVPAMSATASSHGTMKNAAAAPASGVDLAETRQQEREERSCERAVTRLWRLIGGLHRGLSYRLGPQGAVRPPGPRPPLGYPWTFMTTIQPRPDAGSRFRPLAAQPDFPAQEHRILDLWRERQTFLRLRAQNAGNETWSFLDGPITANNPMAVHHAWGRTYKDLYQRFHAMLGQDQRWQNGFDCQGLWVEVNVERELGYTSKRDIERNGIDAFVSLCKQRVLTYAAQQTEQSIRLGMWMDWNDPAELRRLRDLLGRGPDAGHDHRGSRRPGHRHRGDARRAPGHARAGRLLLHVQQREQRPHLGFPGGVPQAWLAVQGPRHDALVRAVWHGHQPDGDERGLPGPRGSRAHRALPAHRQARRVPAGLDHDTLDHERQRGGRGRSGAGLRPGPPG